MAETSKGYRRLVPHYYRHCHRLQVNTVQLARLQLSPASCLQEDLPRLHLAGVPRLERVPAGARPEEGAGPAGHLTDLCHNIWIAAFQDVLYKLENCGKPALNATTKFTANTLYHI